MAIKALINRFNGLRKDKDKALPDLPPPPPALSQSTSAAQQPQSRSTLVSRRPLSTPPVPLADKRTAPLAPLDTLFPPGMLQAIPESSTSTTAPSLPSPSTPTAKPAEHTRPLRTKGSAIINTPGLGAPVDPNGNQKRVAFISPPPTPGGAGLNSLALPSSGAGSGGDSESRRRGNSFNGPTDSRPDLSLGAPAGREKALKARTYSNPSADARQSAATFASARGGTASAVGSRTIPSRQGVTSPYSTSARNGQAAALSTSPQENNLAFSLRSGTPYSHMSGRSFVQAATSWSEAAEEDLVSNIGPRERTRQEVLWEIVTSEERYVQELLKMKETFLDPLLHPFASAQVAPSSPLPGASGFMSLPEEPDELYRPPSHGGSQSHGTQHVQQASRESLDHLPIAARFLSPNASPLMEHDLEGTPSSEDGEMPADPTDVRRATATNTNGAGGQGRSPYGMRIASGGSGGTRSTGKTAGGPVPFPSRSHQSLPPPPRAGANGALSTISLGRDRRADTAQDVHGHVHSYFPPATPPNGAGARNGTPASRVIRKLQKRSPSDADTSTGVSPQALPEDLRECLQVLERGILGGHVALSEMLRRRYEEQYPLVRSLADVFIQHSHILREYATYVLHLERALEQVDAFLSTNVTKKPKKQDAVEWMRISKILQRLEESAADKGETGLAICLSKPFQRLLKYPLLFQNLLFHTDPSTYEYESTLLMVAEVETIVRSIEDEKILKEERDRTRDVFARIDGLDKDKRLAAPKPSRVLVEERLLDAAAGSTDTGNGQTGKDAQAAGAAQTLPSKTVKQKSSFRRLSEALPGSGGASSVGGKKDLWLVVFNDVALRCQRTGVTTMPLALAAGLGPGSKSTSAPDLSGKGKFGTNGKRALHTKPRNMYKFVKIETWAIGEVAKPTVGVVAMEEVTRTHAKLTQEAIADAGLVDEDEGMESDESDRKSKMSFSYWGADKITVKRTPLSAATAAARGGARGGAAARRAAGGRETSADAKFGSRLRNPDHPPVAGGRPMSRTHGPVRRPTNGSSNNEDGKPQRPPWGSNINSAARVPTSTARKAQNTTPPGGTTTALPARKDNPSPVPETVRSTKYSNAPSEDSGVGLYRQIIAANPSINKLNMM